MKLFRIILGLIELLVINYIIINKIVIENLYLNIGIIVIINLIILFLAYLFWNTSKSTTNAALDSRFFIITLILLPLSHLFDIFNSKLKESVRDNFQEKNTDDKDIDN